MIEHAIASVDDANTIRKLEEMIAIPSIVGDEGRLAAYLARELDALGLAVETEEVEPGPPNVYGRMTGDGPGKRLHFNGHLDSVPVVDGWETDPFTPVRRGDRLHGLGACDMKGGLACILTILKALRDSGHRMPGELSVSAVIDEEAYSKGSRAMLRTDFAKVDANDTHQAVGPSPRPAHPLVWSRAAPRRRRRWTCLAGQRAHGDRTWH
jgi:acetylornithine deacetylase/succinyl-diaminopimelate desuccinylase-like protein